MFTIYLEGGYGVLSNENKGLPESIVIGRDRLIFLIGEYKEGIKKEHGWPAPAGIFTSVFLCIAATSDFQSFWFFSVDQTQMLVYGLLILSGVWLVYVVSSAPIGEADQRLMSELTGSIKNKPDYTVIYIIKLTKDEIPRLLVEEKPQWECFFLPHVSRMLELNFSNSIPSFKKTIASYLGISCECVNVDHLTQFSLTSEKYSPKEKLYKQFNFDFLFFTLPKDKMLDSFNQSPFRVGGKTFYWKTLDELMADHKTMDRNGDVIEHLERNYSFFFVNTKDSFH